MSSVAERLAKKSARPKTTKQVRLRLVYVDFWSAVKLSFLVSVCLAVITLVATFLIWTVLNQLGIFTNVQELFTDISGSSTDILTFVQLSNVMGFAIVVAILDLIVVTALGAVFALLYNLSVKITGGLLVGFVNN